MDERTNEHFKDWRGLLWLWAGVAAGPVAVALTQQGAYLLVTLDCSYGRGAALWPVMLLAIAIATGGVFVSWRNWRRAGNEWSDDGGDAASRSRFLAIVGLLFSGFSVMTVIAMWLPALYYRQCQR